MPTDKQSVPLVSIYGYRQLFVLALAILTLAMPQASLAAAPANHLVISEIQLTSATEQFVELYNPTGTRQSLAGYSLQYQAAGSGLPLTTIFNFDSTNSIPAYGYFLLRPNGSLQASDQTYSGIIGLGDGTLALVSSTTAVSSLSSSSIVDLVGYGTATLVEGNAAPSLSGSGSLERLPGANASSLGNALDTNDNRADWQLRGTAEPQTSASAGELPQAPAAVTNLSVVDFANDHGNQLILNFTPPASVSGLTQYRVWRRLASGSYGSTAYATLASTANTFVDTQATSGQSYVYQIESVGSAYSNFSAESVASSAVDNLPATITLTRLQSGSYVATTDPLIEAKIVDPAGVKTVELFLDGQLVRTLVPDAQGLVSYQASGLTQGTHTFLFRVADFAPNIVEKQLVITVDSLAPILDPLRLVSPVTEPKAEIGLSYNDPLGAASSGVVEMRVATDGALDSEGFEPITQTTWRNLAKSSQPQLIVVMVRDRAGNLSNVQTLVVSIKPASLEAPQSLRLVKDGNDIVFSYAAVAGATRYAIRYSDGQTLFGPIYQSGLEYRLSSADMKATYRFEVASVNSIDQLTSFAALSLSPATQLVAETAVSAVTVQATPTVKPATSEASPQAAVITEPESVKPSPAKVEASPAATVTPTSEPSPTLSPESIDSVDDQESINQSSQLKTGLIALISLLVLGGVVWFALGKLPSESKNDQRW
ncbi:MAG: hypothetical protein CEO22_81 [Candidatus Berkelbacteria bacterium Gr01-1014_85]|uniref:LTD domain-containing protein n=1 Tax=Candidatus Berkelbacteria bacterium Gr01-1014_85 TaxID=2017150 RepID=A0A554JDY2_9BACT|nr:MAG: hypothetical protein CEO22_81 [Candidatus Berkelbacteria bacterium Gr01-1014_85]